MCDYILSQRTLEIKIKYWNQTEYKKKEQFK